MTRFVIDPQALIDLVRDGRPVSAGHQLVAPNSVRSQAMELLLQAVKQSRVSSREAMELHERMTELKVRLLGDRVSRRAAWDLAREHGWEGLREAEYLAITQLQADALVTSDLALVRLGTGIVVFAELEAIFADPVPARDELVPDG